MPASMIAPVECLSSSPAPPPDMSSISTAPSEEEGMLAVDLEERLSPTPWQDRRAEVNSEFRQLEISLGCMFFITLRYYSCLGTIGSDLRLIALKIVDWGVCVCALGRGRKTPPFGRINCYQLKQAY